MKIKGASRIQSFNNLLLKGVITRFMEIYKMLNHLWITTGLLEENSTFMESLISKKEF